ncbi:MAG: periplasmic heavy metal sensor [Deltaproteobacteria bacterium]|nr:periplasmic heavy metal sensor [Deltaproteobacteria bacterium]
MRTYLAVRVLSVLLLLAGVARAAEPDRSRPPVPAEWVDLWERFQRAMQERGGQLRDWLGGRESRENRPIISLMLNSRERLGLSDAQVKKLEQLRDDFEKQSIRNDADARIVELDIAALLDNEPVDMAKVEAKIREAEKLRADLRIARLRTIEQAKAVLNSEQKKKLAELTPPPRVARTPRGSNPPATE